MLPALCISLFGYFRSRQVDKESQAFYDAVESQMGSNNLTGALVAASERARMTVEKVGAPSALALSPPGTSLSTYQQRQRGISSTGPSTNVILQQPSQHHHQHHQQQQQQHVSVISPIFPSQSLGSESSLWSRMTGRWKGTLGKLWGPKQDNTTRQSGQHLSNDGLGLGRGDVGTTTSYSGPSMNTSTLSGSNGAGTMTSSSKGPFSSPLATLDRVPDRSRISTSNDAPTMSNGGNHNGMSANTTNPPLPESLVTTNGVATGGLAFMPPSTIQKTLNRHDTLSQLRDEAEESIHLPSSSRDQGKGDARDGDDDDSARHRLALSISHSQVERILRDAATNLHTLNSVSSHIGNNNSSNGDEEGGGGGGNSLGGSTSGNINTADDPSGLAFASVLALAHEVTHPLHAALVAAVAKNERKQGRLRPFEFDFIGRVMNARLASRTIGNNTSSNNTNHKLSNNYHNTTNTNSTNAFQGKSPSTTHDDGGGGDINYASLLGLTVIGENSSDPISSIDSGIAPYADERSEISLPRATSTVDDIARMVSPLLGEDGETKEVLKVVAKALDDDTLDQDIEREAKLGSVRRESRSSLERGQRRKVKGKRKEAGKKSSTKVKRQRFTRQQGSGTIIGTTWPFSMSRVKPHQHTPLRRSLLGDVQPLLWDPSTTLTSPHSYSLSLCATLRSVQLAYSAKTKEAMAAAAHRTFIQSKTIQVNWNHRTDSQSEVKRTDGEREKKRRTSSTEMERALLSRQSITEEQMRGWILQRAQNAALEAVQRVVAFVSEQADARTQVRLERMAELGIGVGTDDVDGVQAISGDGDEEDERMYETETGTGEDGSVGSGNDENESIHEKDGDPTMTDDSGSMVRDTPHDSRHSHSVDGRYDTYYSGESEHGGKRDREGWGSGYDLTFHVGSVPRTQGTHQSTSQSKGNKGSQMRDRNNQSIAGEEGGSRSTSGPTTSRDQRLSSPPEESEVWPNRSNGPSNAFGSNGAVLMTHGEGLKHTPVLHQDAHQHHPHLPPFISTSSSSSLPTSMSIAPSPSSRTHVRSHTQSLLVPQSQVLTRPQPSKRGRYHFSSASTGVDTFITSEPGDEYQTVPGRRSRHPSLGNVASMTIDSDSLAQMMTPSTTVPHDSVYERSQQGWSRYSISPWSTTLSQIPAHVQSTFTTPTDVHGSSSSFDDRHHRDRDHRNQREQRSERGERGETVLSKSYSGAPSIGTGGKESVASFVTPSTTSRHQGAQHLHQQQQQLQPHHLHPSQQVNNLQPPGLRSQRGSHTHGSSNGPSHPQMLHPAQRDLSSTYLSRSTGNPSSSPVPRYSTPLTVKGSNPTEETEQARSNVTSFGGHSTHAQDRSVDDQQVTSDREPQPSSGPSSSSMSNPSAVGSSDGSVPLTSGYELRRGTSLFVD